MRNYMKNVAIYYKGDYAKMHWHIAQQLPMKEIPYEGLFVSIVDDAYPTCLRELEKPPYVLFYEGNLSLLEKPMVAVIGSRKPNEYGLLMTQKLVDVLKREYVIVSGLALGIDGCAHIQALDTGTIGVIGCGVDIVYPQKHKALQNEIKKHHLLISEYPNGVKAQRHHFPFRNRLIAALAKNVYVMSATLYSGTMHTVDVALSLGREVICLPYPIDEESGIGCNQLIQDGASLLTNIEELSNIYNKE